MTPPRAAFGIRRVIPTAALLGVVLFSASAGAGETPYDALGFKPGDVLTGTILNATVLPGEAKQVVCIATYITGKTDKARSVNVKLGVFDRDGDKLVERYVRDLGKEAGGHIGNADLNIFDLDNDGLAEIIFSYDDFGDPLIEQRTGEILAYRDGGFRSVWTGHFEYDATRAARTVPEEMRDRYTRDIDFGATLKTRGITLFMNKTMIAVAGERLDEEQVVREAFPLGERRR